MNQPEVKKKPLRLNQ